MRASGRRLSIIEMTREEAIEILSELPDRIIAIQLPFDINYDYKEALIMAISALSEEDNTMEWIYEGDEISGVFRCSKCGMESEDMDFEHFHFCPNCGRKAVQK